MSRLTLFSIKGTFSARHFQLKVPNHGDFRLWDQTVQIFDKAGTFSLTSNYPLSTEKTLSDFSWGEQTDNFFLSDFSKIHMQEALEKVWPLFQVAVHFIVP